jgi:flavin reductase (DIM6/NTAB) family NADH-FMN oxidoreductase RutF
MINPLDFRNTMGRFATGVTIITTEVEAQVHGMTANAFMSVSLDPPLVLVSVGNRANLNTMLPHSGRYGVSFLSESQQPLSQHFAGRPIEGLEIPFIRKHDMSLIAGALGHIVTQIVESYKAGDHTLYLGQVEYLAWQDERPLLFYGGRYRVLNPEVESHLFIDRTEGPYMW